MPKTGAYKKMDFSLTPMERVEALWLDLTTDPDYDGFDTVPLRHVRLLSASADNGKGRTTFELTVSPSLCNKGGNLHGGAAATLLDSLTSTALTVIAKPGFLDGGHVSRSITMTYLRPVPAGTTVTVECDVVAAGRNTAHIMGVIKTLDGKVCVTCAHDKAVFPKKAKL